MFKRKDNSSRSGTTMSWMSKKFTKSELPKASGKTKAEEETPTVPTYAHADKQTGPVDTEAEDRARKDEEIREDAGKNKDDEEQPKTKFVRAEKKALGGEKHDGPSTEVAIKVPSVFNRFWKLELDYDLEDVVKSNKSFWTPNALAMFEVLEASGRYVFDNHVARKKHPRYLDYATACYYSILFYIQILRVQKATGNIHGKDRSFINRFLDKFKPEELVVSSILEPFFSTLVATLPKDTKYEWIIPQYSTDILRTSFAAPPTHGRGACYIQPMVPYMLRILRTVLTRGHITAINADADEYFDDRGRYITHSIAAHPAHTTLFGQNFATGVDPQDERNTFFSMCGVRYPFFTDIDSLAQASAKLRDSTFAQYPFGTGFNNSPAAEGQNPARPITAGSLDIWMDMGKDSDANMEWFTELKNQAALHARFFEGQTTLSNIPVTSGNEPLILCKYKKKVAGAIRANLPIHLNQGGGAARNPAWYPETFKNYLGEFTTTRAGVSREEVLQAMTNGTNGNIDVDYTVNNVTYRVGSGVTFHTGPYWDNTEIASEKFHDAGTAGKQMFRGWETMFQEDAALEKPTGY